MNLSGVLSIGGNGLTGATHGTQVASQNIANASTPGYTRRIANLEAAPISMGGGVRANGTSRINDQFLEKRNLAACSSAGDSDARVKTLGVLDTVFADGQGSVGEALDAFDTALSDLTVTPNSNAVRQVVLTRADDLAQAFHRSSDALTTARGEANGRIVQQVKDVNQKLDQIGTLNSQIVQAKAAKQEPGDLMDKRDQLIREISDTLPVTVLPNETGAVTVTLAGQRTLVDANADVHHLLTTTDGTSGEVRIARQTAGVQEDITGLFTMGSIGGTIAARDGALADAQTALDQLAFDISAAYNAVHTAGIGSDGNTGRNLFAVATTTAGAAMNFNVSADVAGQPGNIAAAQDVASLPSDNRNALALVALHDQRIGLGGTATAQQSFASMVAAGGAAMQSAADQSDYATSQLTQIEAMRESASGVNTDEEMLSLMKYQRAYQASLRVIEAADSMLSDLLNMRRG